MCKHTVYVLCTSSNKKQQPTMLMLVNQCHKLLVREGLNSFPFHLFFLTHNGRKYLISSYFWGLKVYAESTQKVIFQQKIIRRFSKSLFTDQTTCERWKGKMYSQANIKAKKQGAQHQVCNYR